MIPGNHDSAYAIKKRFMWYKETAKISIDDWLVYMSHYPHFTWPNRHDKCIGAFGHSHGFFGHDIRGRRFDIGVDCWSLSPVNFETLKNLVLIGEDYQI
jgi:calcineurin-like phosphoesterase family protein